MILEYWYFHNSIFNTILIFKRPIIHGWKKGPFIGGRFVRWPPSLPVGRRLHLITPCTLWRLISCQPLLKNNSTKAPTQCVLHMTMNILECHLLKHRNRQILGQSLEILLFLEVVLFRPSRSSLVYWRTWRPFTLSLSLAIDDITWHTV